MKKNKKICNCGCGKEGYIWSKGLLKECYYRLNIPKPIKKVSENSIKLKRSKIERSKLIHEAMYQWWLKQDENRCMSCNCKLPEEFHTWMVDHLLEKSVYPELALSESNFYLTCLEHHHLKTNGFPHPKHKIAIEKIKEKYESNSI